MYLLAIFYNISNNVNGFVNEWGQSHGESDKKRLCVACHNKFPSGIPNGKEPELL